MKHKYFKFLIFFFIVTTTYSQVTTINFETINDGYTPSTTFGSGNTDTFNRVNVGVNSNSSYYWVAEDISGDPSIDLTQIPVIPGTTSFTFAIDLSYANDAQWDSTDEMLITYSLNGGSYENLMSVQHINSDSFNNPAALDLDFDGHGDAGQELSTTEFKTFTTSPIAIAGSITTIDIKIQFNKLTSNGEGIFLDNIKITQSSGNTPPQITSISSSPTTPTSSDVVTVITDATDADGIASVNIKWGTTSGNLTNTVAMSNSSGNTYSGNIPAQADGTTVYYAVEATDSNASPETTTSSESNYIVTDPIPTTIPYEIDLTTNDPFINNWTKYSVSGTEEWNWSNGSGVEMNAFSGSCQTNEDWLISPSFDLTSYQKETLKFEIDETFDGTTLEVLYSRDYTGTGDPNNATWTSVGTTFSNGTTFTSDFLSILNPATNVHIAFKYVFATGSCSKWSVKNLEIKERFTWEGNTDNNWNTASNWRTNSVPKVNSDVLISAGSAYYPTVNSAITNISKIYFESGATAIFETTINADIEFKRDINSADWKLVSPPVSGESIENMLNNNTFGQDPSGTKEAFSFYTNSGVSAWDYQASNATGAISNGTGIAVNLNASSLVFNGKLNTNPVSINISQGDRTNFNLIGNPYTAYVNSSSFLNNFSNFPVLSEQTIWLWDGSKYVTRNLANPIEISPAQGFFVKAGTDATVTINTSMLSHQNSDTFMRSSKISIELIAKIDKNKMSTEIYYIDGTTKGFDNGYDGTMFSTSKNFSLYSQLVTNNEGKNYAIQSLPINEMENISVPIGLNAKAGKEISFSVNSKNLPNNTEVYLEDRLNNILVNISNTEYKTTLKNDIIGIGQFYLRVTSKKLDTPIANSIKDISLYKSAPNTLTVIGLQSKESSLKIYSILGKKIVQQNFSSNGFSNINIPSLTAGVYIVELSTELGKTSKKIILE